jgi:hypothetical protein
VRELGGREFSQYLVHHLPHSTERNLDPRFEAFEWCDPRRRASGYPAKDRLVGDALLRSMRTGNLPAH